MVLKAEHCYHTILELPKLLQNDPKISELLNCQDAFGVEPVQFCFSGIKVAKRLLCKNYQYPIQGPIGSNN
jgi:hypothetical protein